MHFIRLKHRLFQSERNRSKDRADSQHQHKWFPFSNSPSSEHALESWDVCRHWIAWRKLQINPKPKETSFRSWATSRGSKGKVYSSDPFTVRVIIIESYQKGVWRVRPPLSSLNFEFIRNWFHAYWNNKSKFLVVIITF